jgi:hypothetical protein
MKTNFYISGALLAVLGFIPSGATAQAIAQLCGERSEIVGNLAEKYEENQIALGVTDAGGLVEVLSTRDGETWTIIVSMPDGKSCLLAVGQGWREVKAKPILTGAGI